MSPDADNMDLPMITLKFDRHLGSIAAEMPVKFQSHAIIPTTNLTA